MNSRELQQALRSGKRVYGTLLLSPAPSWASQMKKLGIDFTFIDTEHVSLDRHQISWMCQAYKAMELTPLVRVYRPDHHLATMALDGGAGGIIAPYVESVEQAQMMRGAVKMRPLRGKKVQAIVEGREELTGELKTYIEEYNQDNVLILNIESVPGLEALDDILKVPDIDAILVGPHDLSCSLGIPEQYKHSDFVDAVKTIFSKARAAGVGAGMHFWAGMDQQIEWARDAGMNLIIHRADILNFVESMSREIKEIKEALGDGVST